MKQYTTTAHFSSLFGMDVHARSVVVRGIDRLSGELMSKRFCNCPTASDIAEWMEENFTAPHYAAYESGCTGFHLAKELEKLGIVCDVIAISSLARSSDDKQRKTDKTDARRLLAELLMMMPTYTTVWIPDDECEADRDLARARTDAVMSVKRAKQQLSALLLRHGYVWNEKTAGGNCKKTWGHDHWAWIKRIDLKEVGAQGALAFYKRAIEEGTERIKSLDAIITKRSECSRWKPCVDALMLFKGIDVYTAFLLTVEFGGFSRFENGRSVSKWLGTVPTESSSDEKIYHGHITKAGNVHCRGALTEGVAAIKRHVDSPKRPRAGAVVSADTMALCAKAQRRLSARYHHFVHDSKLHANKARMAVINEMIRWVWMVGLCVQAELKACS